MCFENNAFILKDADIVTLPLTSILTLVEPRTTTGRTYSVNQRDSRAARAKLKTVL